MMSELEQCRYAYHTLLVYIYLVEHQKYIGIPSAQTASNGKGAKMVRAEGALASGGMDLYYSNMFAARPYLKNKFLEL